MGEGTGNDALIMPFITSANIACGYHAGDENTMRTTITMAKNAGVAIGAHPSFLDKEPQEIHYLLGSPILTLL